jgi:hypothetical protein
MEAHPPPGRRQHDPGNDPGEDDEYGAVPFDRMVLPRPAPDDNPDTLSKPDRHKAEWWYDQRGKRGNNRRYTGRVERLGGSAGEKLRLELAATIRDLLEWAQQQQVDSESTGESREDGAADDRAE